MMWRAPEPQADVGVRYTLSPPGAAAGRQHAGRPTRRAAADHGRMILAISGCTWKSERRQENRNRVQDQELAGCEKLSAVILRSGATKNRFSK